MRLVDSPLFLFRGRAESFWTLFRVVSGSPAPPKLVYSTLYLGGFLPLGFGVSGKGWGSKFSVDDSIDRSLFLRCLQCSFP